jgi:hypothetical protein
MPSCLPNRTGYDVVEECRKEVCLWFVLFSLSFLIEMDVTSRRLRIGGLA